MTLRSLEASELAIPFKGAFKHASAERHAMQSLWVRVYSESGAQGFGEGCPREYVTGESISAALAFVDRAAGVSRDAAEPRASLLLGANCSPVTVVPARLVPRYVKTGIDLVLLVVRAAPIRSSYV